MYKEPKVLTEAAEIVQKRFNKEESLTLLSAHAPYFRGSSYRFQTEVSPLEYWRGMLARPRELLQIDLLDETAEMRQEISTLKRELSSHKQAIDELRKLVHGGLAIKPTTPVTIDELCKNYVEIVSTISIVRQVFLVESKDVLTIWTIIDAPPFEDSLRTPIYKAQLDILSALKENTTLDFYILNVLELSKDENLQGIIPSDAKLVWER